MAGGPRRQPTEQGVEEEAQRARGATATRHSANSDASELENDADMRQASRDVHPRLRALRAAFPYTLPIFAGFWFLGLTYGVYMHTLGFSFVYPTLMALVIFGGSLEFLIAGMLVSPFAPMATLLVTLAVQARHLFYGIAMLDRYKDTGWMQPYLIFGMCDETFSILYSADVPEGVNRRWFMFWVTLLNHLYWVSGAAIGGLAGNLVTFNTNGLSFVMTALFVVILLDQVLKEKDHTPTMVGAIAAVVSLVAFGAGDFMIPALAGMVVALVALRGRLDSGATVDADADADVRENAHLQEYMGASMGDSVYRESEAGDAQYDELHVDAGVHVARHTETTGSTSTTDAGTYCAARAEEGDMA